MVSRAILIVALAAAPARAEPTTPTTWLNTSFVVGDLGGHRSATDGWRVDGIGFRVAQMFGEHLELGGELHALKLYAANDSDPRIGFALRGIASIGYRLTAHGRIDWTAKPEVGVGSSIAFGLGGGEHAFDEVFAGLELSVHVPLYDRRAWGGHLEVRMGESQGMPTLTALIGHDWGW